MSATVQGAATATDVLSTVESVERAGSQHSLPSFLNASTSRFRSRPELAVAHAIKNNARQEPVETYELPTLPPDAVARSRQSEPPVNEATSRPSSASSRVLRGAQSRETPTRTPAQYRAAGWHLFAFCYVLFLTGWNDGSTGPLLPKIQAFYGLDYAVVSLVFIFNAVGFVVGAAMIVPLVERFGMGKVCALLQLLAYVMQVPAGPFPEFAASFTIAGFGMCLQGSQANAFLGGLPEDTAAKLGLLHGAYGFGAFAAPLAATYFSTQGHWSYHYIINLGLSVLNFVILTAVFRFKSQDVAMQDAGYELAPTEPSSGRGGQYGTILSIRAVYFLAAFVLIYVGVEVTLGGWIVTFIIRERAGDSSSGYISSGFFGGLAIGRVVLIWLNKRIGEARAITLYSIVCIALQVTVWAIPSLVENAVAVSVVGLLMGPIYPIMVGQTSKILPRFVLSAALGIINGLGQTGSALLPFLTGILANKFGISSLQPFVVSMMVSMTIIWFATPKGNRRQE
ncbi:MFS general substrate transporter [Peniophora sp. CONT]|nr:MFS general substrate transporter [Peniophora sp. CONT]